MDMKKILPAFLVLLFCALSGCAPETPASSLPAEPASSSSPGVSSSSAPGVSSSSPSSAAPLFDLYDYYNLPESVEILDPFPDRTEPPYTEHAMAQLKDLFAHAMAGEWELARQLASSIPGAFDRFEEVKISDFQIRKVDILDSYDTALVSFDLTVEGGDDELFQPGTTPWEAKLVLSESNWAEYILPKDQVLTPCQWAQMEPAELFCFTLASYLPQLRGDDFTPYLKPADETEMYYMIDSACCALTRANLPEVPYTPETKSPEAFYRDMEKVFGVDLWGVDLSQYSSYLAYQMIIPVPKGGRWVYAVTADTGQEADTQTVTLDLYADTICWSVASTLRYTLTQNEDGSFRLLSVDELYSSGLSWEKGSL